MKKLKKIVPILLVTILVTGCTQYKTYNKESVTIPETGQKVVENILCKTEATETQYEKLKQEKINAIDLKLQNAEMTQEQYDEEVKKINEAFNLDNVTYCSEFKIFSGDDGLWTTLLNH